MTKLLGKRAIVTAGAQGIGLAISQQLLRAGCDLFVHYRTSAAAAQTLAREATTLGRRCAIGSGDLSETEDSERIVGEARSIQHLGKLATRDTPLRRGGRTGRWSFARCRDGV